MGPLTKGHIAVQMTVTSWVLTAPAPGQGVWAHKDSFYGRCGLQSRRVRGDSQLCDPQPRSLSPPSARQRGSSAPS